MDTWQGTIMKKRKRVLLALGCYNHQVHEGVARYANEADWQLISTCERQSMLPAHWHGEGLIVNQWEPERIEEVLPAGELPTVSMCELPFGADVAIVTQDNQQIGCLAAEHLLSRGFEHFIAVIMGDLPLEKQRIEGFGRAIKEAGHDCTVLHMGRDISQEHADDPWNWLGQRLSQAHGPVGVFCPSDFLGAEVIETARQHDLAVPEQAAVVGAGNHALIADNAPVPLSSVDGNHELWGYRAARQLDELLQGRPAPTTPVRVESGEVVKRTSSDILAITHLGVARALRFIWENFHEPIDVADVVEAVAPITRRGLEKAFRRHLSRSPAQEILRKRLDRAKEMILENQHKSYEIAKLCGFRDAEHLREIFHRHVGMAPRTYRKMYEDGYDNDEELPANSVSSN